MSADTRPDYHFLLIAPNLGAEWLFDAARTYWEAFRPTVIEDFNFLIFVPPGRTISVTVIARRDTAPHLGVELSQIDPDAYFDAVVYDLFDDAKAELDRRASMQQPFGVPLIPRPGTPDPNAPIIPTPRLPPTRPPAGFVTATPAPTQTPADAPAQTGTLPASTPDSADGTRAPVTPPPGPITGGN